MMPLSYGGGGMQVPFDLMRRMAEDSSASWVLGIDVLVEKVRVSLE